MIEVVEDMAAAHLRQVAHGEIIFLTGIDAARLAQDVRHRRLNGWQHILAHRRHRDGGDPCRTRNAALVGAQRHDHDVVLVGTEGRLAFRDKRADHLAGHGVNADGAAQRVFTLKQFAHQRRADHTDGGAAAGIGLAERGPCGEDPVLGFEIAGFGAGHRGVLACRAIDDFRLLGGGRRHGAHAGQAVAERFHIALAEAARIASGGRSRRRCARPRDQHVAAEFGEFRGHAAFRTLADGDEGNHRSDTDDDAKQCQDRAQHVAADGAERQLDGFPDHAATLRSERICPSAKITLRWA
jgi:hypothetical protein